MDPRIPRWARTLVGYCLDVQPREVVSIYATPAAAPLVAEVVREVLRAGGHPLPQITLPEAREVLLSEGSDEQLGWISPTERALAEHADCRLVIQSETTTQPRTAAAPERLARVTQAARAVSTLRAARPVGERWCLTLFPTAGYAHEAGMPLHDFEEFVYGACFLNSEEPADEWRALGQRQQRYVDWLAGKRNVRVLGPETDLRLSIAGRTFINSDGRRNFPSGEFFTGPVEDSVEGHIHFAIPSVVNGTLVRDVRLRFSEGRVVEATASEGQAYLTEMLAMDEGASRVGEFAFGNNFGIQRPIHNILFDEKIGGTIHMALGNSYPETGGKNTSALHWDMICDLRASAGGGEVWVDGERLLHDGTLLALE